MGLKKTDQQNGLFNFVMNFCAYIQLCRHSTKNLCRRIAVNHTLLACMPYSLVLKMEVVHSFETSVTSTRSHHQDNLNSHKISIPYADFSFHLRSSQAGLAGMADGVKWKL